MDQLQPAIDYVQRHGSPQERARLRHVLYGEPPPDDVREGFERSQRSDGGWAAAWSPDYASLDATCYQLSLVAQLGIDHRSWLVIDAVRFLAERQNFDGSWEEDPAEAEAAPVWARPGDSAARLYLTANCGYRVAVTGLVPMAAHDAAMYLSYHLDEHGGLPSFPHTHWLATALWQKQGMVDEAEKGLAHLHDRISHLSAGNLAWMILTLRGGGIDMGHKTVAAALDRLEALRDPAGHWPSDEGADNAVHVTVEAIQAMQPGGRLER